MSSLKYIHNVWYKGRNIEFVAVCTIQHLENALKVRQRGQNP